MPGAGFIVVGGGKSNKNPCLCGTSIIMGEIGSKHDVLDYVREYYLVREK